MDFCPLTRLYKQQHGAKVRWHCVLWNCGLFSSSCTRKMATAPQDTSEASECSLPLLWGKVKVSPQDCTKLQPLSKYSRPPCFPTTVWTQSRTWLILISVQSIAIANLRAGSIVYNCYCFSLWGVAYLIKPCSLCMHVSDSCKCKWFQNRSGF